MPPCLIVLKTADRVAGPGYYRVTEDSGMACRAAGARVAELRRTSILSQTREVLLWLGTKRRRSMFATKSHTFTGNEIVYLVRFKRLERRHLYALGV